MNKIFVILSLLLLSFSSVVSAEIILAEEAREMLDEHVKQSSLLKVPLPKDNRVIKNYDRYKDYRKNILANNYHFTGNMWKKESHKGKTLTKWKKLFAEPLRNLAEPRGTFAEPCGTL